MDSIRSFISDLYPDVHTSTPLHFIVLCRVDEHIKAILDLGASPAARNREGDTPLHLTLVSEEYREDIGEKVSIDGRLFLLEENPFGSYGFSHCHIACLFGNLEIVRSFLDRGLDPNRHRIIRRSCLKDNGHLWHGDTCLHVATHAGHSDVVQLLLERGANPNVCNKSLYTPLHIATYDSQGSATKLLLEYGGDVNARNHKGQTPLHVQCSSAYHTSGHYSEYKVVKALLDAGADVNLVNHLGVSALQVTIHDDTNDDSKVYQLMFNHAVGLQEAGFDLTKENLEKIIEEFEENADMMKYRNDCRCELERMSRVRLDARTTLRDVLHIGPRGLQRLADNEKFGRIVADEAALDCEYPIYGYLARLQYRRGARIKEALLAMEKLYACSAKNDNGLPQECAEMVLRYLTLADQRRLIIAALL